MKKLVVVADDFGLCTSVNDGALEAHSLGCVTELSLMLGSPGTADAIRRIKELGLTNVGIHILLTHWQTTGKITRQEDYQALFAQQTPQQLNTLLRSELNYFEQVLGFRPSHITSQYGLLTNPKIWSTMLEYATHHGIPVRLPIHTFGGDEPVMDPFALQQLRASGVASTTHIFAHIYGNFLDIRAALLREITRVNEGESAEIVLHPGFMSDQLVSLSSLTYQRERDVRLATDDEFNEQVQKMGFVFGTYL